MRHAAQTCLVAGAKARSRWGEHLGREVSEVVEDDTLELIGFVLDLVELLSRPGDDVMRKREQASGLVWRCASCTRSSIVRERLRCRSGCPSEVMFPIVPPSSFDPIVRERLQILGPAECWLGVEAPSEAMSSMPSWLPSSQIVDMRSAWSSSCPRVGTWVRSQARSGWERSGNAIGRSRSGMGAQRRGGACRIFLETLRHQLPVDTHVVDVRYHALTLRQTAPLLGQLHGVILSVFIQCRVRDSRRRRLVVARPWPGLRRGAEVRNSGANGFRSALALHDT